MKIKNRFFEENMGEINKLSDMDLPATLSFGIAKGLKKINEMSKIYFETKQKLLNKYGTLSKEKDRYTFDGKNTVLFNKEMGELLEIENEIPFEKVMLPGDTIVSPKFILALEDFIEIKN